MNSSFKYYDIDENQQNGIINNQNNQNSSMNNEQQNNLGIQNPEPELTKINVQPQKIYNQFNIDFLIQNHNNNQANQSIQQNNNNSIAQEQSQKINQQQTQQYPDLQIYKIKKRDFIQEQLQQLKQSVFYCIDTSAIQIEQDTKYPQSEKAIQYQRCGNQFQKLYTQQENLQKKMTIILNPEKAEKDDLKLQNQKNGIISITGHLQQIQQKQSQSQQLDQKLLEHLDNNLDDQQLQLEVSEDEKENQQQEQRYYNQKQNSTIQCRRCKSMGHYSRMCSQEMKMCCFICMGNHSYKECNKKSCFKCNKQGHMARECPTQGIFCRRCGKNGHKKQECQVILIDKKRDANFDLENDWAENGEKYLKCMKCLKKKGHIRCDSVNIEKCLFNEDQDEISESDLDYKTFVYNGDIDKIKEVKLDKKSKKIKKDSKKQKSSTEKSNHKHHHHDRHQQRDLDSHLYKNKQSEKNNLFSNQSEQKKIEKHNKNNHHHHHHHNDNNDYANNHQVDTFNRKYVYQKNDRNHEQEENQQDLKYNKKSQKNKQQRNLQIKQKQEQHLSRKSNNNNNNHKNKFEYSSNFNNKQGNHSKNF